MSIIYKKKQKFEKECRTPNKSLKFNFSYFSPGSSWPEVPAKPPGHGRKESWIFWPA